MTLNLRIVRAKDADLPVVLGLIEDARNWLPTKDTDQWAKPYPDLDRKIARVQESIERGETWIVWEGATPVATVTIKTERDSVLWSDRTCVCNAAEPAVYVHRLITARKYSGLGLGSELIGWAGLRGSRSYGAKWVRVDVWTTNLLLHKYYMGIGFAGCGEYDDRRYPSGALFQKPVAAIELETLHIPQFAGFSADFSLPGKRAGQAAGRLGPTAPAGSGRLARPG